MNAERFLELLTQALYVVVFLVVVRQVMVRRRRATIDAAIFFAAIALIIAESWVSEVLGLTTNAVLTVATQLLLMALPYLLLRLVDDFAGVPERFIQASGAGLAVSVVVLLAARGQNLPGVLTLLLVLYFVVVTGYIAVAVVRAARGSSGITKRRMWAVAAGTLGLGLVIVVAGLQTGFPQSPRWIWHAVSDVLGLCTGIAYFIGFAPPSWLRRAWQEPELRKFLGRAAALPRLPSTAMIVAELERGASASLGTGEASVALWNSSAENFDLLTPESQSTWPLIEPIARRSFAEERWAFTPNAMADNPDAAPALRARRINSILSVPIGVGGTELGVLTLYAARAPLFAEDDLTLANLLADQAAVILESRALIDEAARVRAREEAARLKDDFLSAAAHDLKTPLTSVIAQTQLLERRALRNPAAPADLTGIQRVLREAQRLRRLVTELLDLSRVEAGNLVGRREECDLGALVQEVVARYPAESHTFAVQAEEGLAGVFDVVRVEQLIDNLLENAVKYSPNGGEIVIRAWGDGGVAHLTVSDPGIGIPAEDLPHLFDRFHRGTNVDDRRFAGMGLGLYICRGIAEQHGGTLWATSAGSGHGSTFHVELPLLPMETSVGEASPASVGASEA